MIDRKMNIKPSQRLQVGDMGTHRTADPMWPVANIASEYEPPCIEVRSDTSIFLVLDRSGSMDAVREATIEGINAFVQRAASSDQPARLTLTTFATDFSVVVDGIDLQAFRPIGKRDYRPSGGTALLDAIARSIALADARVLRGEMFPGHALFVIMTDGEENSSRQYSRSALANLIADREAFGYEFLYLGANQDSFEEAGSMGVCHAANWENDEHGTRLNMERARRIASEKIAGRRVDTLSEAEIQPTAEDAAWVEETMKGRKPAQ